MFLIYLWQQASRCQTYDTRHRCHTPTTGVKQWPKPSNGRLDDAAGQSWLMPCSKRVSAAVQGIAEGACQAGWYLVVLLQRLVQASVCQLLGRELHSPRPTAIQSWLCGSGPGNQKACELFLAQSAK